MRNLRNTHRSLAQRPEDRRLTACTWDVNGLGSIVCAFGPTKDDVLLELKRWEKFEQVWKPIASWDAPCPLPDLVCDEVVDLHHFSDTSTSVLVQAGGDLVVVREQPTDFEDKIEIVGSVDAGISAAAWSPDEELLVLATRHSTVLYMTRDFENVVSLELTSEDFKASNHVSVGWGKKETQFKGKKARALRDPTMPERVDEGVLHPSDTGNVTVSWRGDGAYVAINSVQDCRRVVRVYSREGVIDSVSEPVDNLMQALSWRPAGNLIAGIQRLEKSVKVVFFEKNGLRHGDFNLRLTKEELQSWGSSIELKWNIDSSVLAVCFQDRVHLWQMGNYHYYLKQGIMCGGSSSRLVSFCWHPERPLHFILCDGDVAQRFSYASVIANATTSPPLDYGITAVIDGETLKLTPLRHANIPPPMALHEVQLSENIVDVAILELKDGRGVLLAILHQQAVSLYKWDTQSDPRLLRQKFLAPFDVDAYQMYLQATFGPDHGVYVFQKSLNGARLIMLSAKEDMEIWAEASAKLLNPQVEVLVPQRLHNSSHTFLTADKRSLSAADALSPQLDGSSGPALAHRILPTSNYTTECLINSFDTPQGANATIHGNLANGVKHTEPSLFFHMDEQGTLFADERKISAGCTSFLATRSHLLFTSKNLLKFVHLVEDVEQLQVPLDTPETDERCRSIERGAKLVTVMPSIFAVVLQMPRGNLETIYPRALVLAGIRDSINRKEYRKAFLACRNHRVDMNILHDHAPQQFLASVGLFTEKVKKPEHIDLFLSQLREEDVSRTMYRETIRLSSGEAAVNDAWATTDFSSSKGAKVNRICDAFLQDLEGRTSEHLQNIISAHVCKSPPDLDAALLQIAKLRKEQSDYVDSMIEHICFLADSNKLYDNALGLYDLETTLLIAQQSQKDPKEYLPFLQNLQKMSPLRKQYSIDDFLARRAKALRHLCDLDAFGEVKSYVVKYTLYTEGLAYYRYQGEKYQELTRLYAEYLQQQRNFKEAGIAYESFSDHVAASESFRQAHLWQESLSNATQARMETQQLTALAASLSDTLSESKDFSSAATINLEYLSDIPAAARLFCKGYHFPNAIRIACLYQRLDLLESIIDPGLQEGMATMTDLLAECKSQLNAQIPRIRELRAKKAEDPLAFWDGDIPGGGDVPDDTSIAPTNASTTGGSLFTRYTNRTGTVGTNATRRTSKNRRREERKRARGKKGSVYEEEYLVNSIARLIERVNMVNDEVYRLVVGLMRRRMKEQARAVEGAIGEVVEMCRGCVVEVFQNENVEDQPRAEQPTNAEVEADGYHPQGGDAFYLKSLEGSREPREAPIVKSFERLKLLGG